MPEEDLQTIAVDIETTSLHPDQGDIRLITWADGKGSYASWKVEDSAEVLKDPRVIKVFHNAAFDVTWLEWKGYKVVNYTDTMVLAQVLRGEARGGNSLEQLAHDFLGISLNKGLQTAENWQGTLTEEHLQYAKDDAEVTLKLYERLVMEIDRAGLQRVVQREIRTLAAVIRLQLNGIPFDFDGWQVTLGEYEREAQELERSIRLRLRNESLNLRSPAQLMAALRKIGLDVQSTSDEALAKVEHVSPVVRDLRLLRKKQKVVSAYGDKLKDAIGDDGRIRASWRLIGANTGRMSCSEPNVQGLPGRAKAHCKAAPGWRIVSADYSQIELRVLAQLADDPVMKESFAQGADLHRRAAAMILNKGTEQVTDEERGLAKTANFGLVYGMTTYGLRKKLIAEFELNLPLEAVERFRNGYFSIFQGVRRFQDQMLRAKQVRSLGGRRWDAQSLKGIQRFNWPVQSTAAEGFKEALGLLMQHIPDHWNLIAAVHDEIVLEVPEQEEVEAERLLQFCMTTGMNRLVTDVPLQVDVKKDNCWKK